MESGTNNIQKLKAEIAALVQEYDESRHLRGTPSLNSFIGSLRQLSAI
jgi:hypothetical protein